MEITCEQKPVQFQTTVLRGTKMWAALNPTTTSILDKMLTVVTTGIAAEADPTTTRTTGASTAAQMVTTTITPATTDKITRKSITANHMKCQIHPMFSNSSQVQETLINNISTQQTRMRIVSQAAITDTRTTIAVTTSRAVGFAHMFSAKQYR